MKPISGSSRIKTVFEAEHVNGPDLWFGRTDRLAEYATANEYFQEIWAQLLETAAESVP